MGEMLAEGAVSADGVTRLEESAVAFTPRGHRLELPEGTIIRFKKDHLSGPSPSEENTGLECPDCGAKQKRVDCSIVNGALFARLSLRIESQRELQGVWSLLKLFLPRLPKGGAKK